MNRSLGLAVALVLAALGCTPQKDSCNLPSIKCGDHCLDGSSDPQNCGACGNVCGAGATCCSGACLDPAALQTDVANCGSCGNRCALNGTCSAGTCGCGDPAFPNDCGGACVNLQTGASGSCGSCGWTCAAPGVSGADAPCTAGACVCAGTPQATDCGNGGSGQCVNTLTDEWNCGGCGATGNPYVCKPYAVCTGGSCGCTAPAYPDDCPARCVNKATDPANCGACDHACSGATPSCQSGLCCPTGQTNCSGVCTDTRTSATSCGSCGHACAAGQSCSNGICACGGQTPRACGSSCCAGTACCGTSCQIQHSNGLGGSFYDCNALYLPATTTLAAATLAAQSWMAGTTYTGLCDGSCVGQQSANSCAVWCYALSTYGGRGSMANDTSCSLACANLYAGASIFTWR